MSKTVWWHCIHCSRCFEGPEDPYEAGVEDDWLLPPSKEIMTEMMGKANATVSSDKSAEENFDDLKVIVDKYAAEGTRARKCVYEDCDGSPIDFFSWEGGKQKYGVIYPAVPKPGIIYDLYPDAGWKPMTYAERKELSLDD